LKAIFESRGGQRNTAARDFAVPGSIPVSLVHVFCREGKHGIDRGSSAGNLRLYVAREMKKSVEEKRQ